MCGRDSPVELTTGVCGSGEELNLSVFPTDAPSSCLGASSGKDGRLLFPCSPHAAGGAAQGVSPGCAAGKRTTLRGAQWGHTMVTGLGTAKGSFTSYCVWLRFPLRPQGPKLDPKYIPRVVNLPWLCRCPVPLLLWLQLLLHTWRWSRWEQESSKVSGGWEWDGSAFGTL